MEPLLTVKEAAQVLALSPFTVKRMLKAGVLPFVRLNHSVVRICPEDLKSLIQLKTTRRDYWKAATEETYD